MGSLEEWVLWNLNKVWTVFLAAACQFTTISTPGSKRAVSGTVFNNVVLTEFGHNRQIFIGIALCDFGFREGWRVASCFFGLRLPHPTHPVFLAATDLFPRHVGYILYAPQWSHIKWHGRVNFPVYCLSDYTASGREQTFEHTAWDEYIFHLGTISGSKLLSTLLGMNIFHLGTLSFCGRRFIDCLSW